jgi:pimeloyl-ACP methyl ester carboxylesterase
MRAEILDTRGSGPPLVYVPGIDGSGELLLGTAQRLAREFSLTRLCYDGGAEGGYGALAASVAQRIEELGRGPVLVLAVSFGVAVALETALDHPEHVRGLALVNGFARFPGRLSLAFTRGVFALAPQAWIHRARALVAQPGLFAPRRDVDALRRLVALPGNWFGAPYRSRLALIHGCDLRPRLGAIRCPVALYASDHDRVVAAVAAAREMAARLSDCELTVIERAGHVVLPLTAEPWEERLRALARRAGF